MAAKNLKLVEPDLEQMETAVTEAASQSAPIVSRYQTHLNKTQATINELQREAGDFADRRALLKAAFDAADAGLAAHEQDIAATIALHSAGMPAKS